MNNNWGFNNRGRHRGGPNWGGFSRGRGRGWGQNHNFGFPNARPQNYGGPNNQWKKKPRRDMPTKRLSEDAIGVTEYISEHEGFNGIIKSRYSDFQVSEINENGEVAKLTDKSTPDPPAEETVDEDEDLLLNKYNVEILPMETWDKINSLVSGVRKDVVEIDVKNISKEQRTKIHEAVKKAFGKAIVGTTVNIEDKKLIKFDKFRKGIRVDRRVKWVWPAEYVHFIVHKENCDTIEAAVRIAERLRINLRPTVLGYSGTKDRRAKTSQWFSLRKVDPRKVVNSCKDLRDLHIGNFSFSKTHLKLGMLKGNVFRIALRNVTAPDDSIHVACENLRSKGFINYYGLQRFGSRINTPTYDIGLKLLQGNLKEAIDSVLEEREGPLERALSAFKNDGAKVAAMALPKYASASQAEIRLIQALAVSNDLVAAINRIPRNVRLLYLHSYQSLVWNKAVSERIRRFGLKPAVGDFVPLTEVNDEVDIDDDESDDEDSKNNSGTFESGDSTDKKPTDVPSEQDGDLNQDGDSKQDGGSNDNDGGSNQTKDEEPNQDVATAEVPSQESKSEPNKSKNEPQEKIPVKVLTQEDIDGQNYTIFDIVMPLPGYNIDYPPNMKDFYSETLNNDGLQLEMKHKMKSCRSFNLSGAYRHVIARPMEMSWRCVTYNDPYADLIASDLDEMQNRKIKGIVEGGKYKALLLTMSLPSSCYATMALRELLKVDTSCDFQALQNNYHKKKTEKEADIADKEVNEGQRAEGKGVEGNEDGQSTEDKGVEGNKDGQSTEDKGVEGNKDGQSTEDKGVEGNKDGQSTEDKDVEGIEKDNGASKVIKEDSVTNKVGADHMEEDTAADGEGGNKRKCEEETEESVKKQKGDCGE